MAEQVNIADSVDRIGSLPDGVLCHILSFLPTKMMREKWDMEAVPQRWKYLFPVSNNLHFEESLVFNCQRNGQSLDDRTGRFLDFVDRCIVRMNATLVDKFSLQCDCSIDPSRVNSWIGSAPLQNVRELDLCILTRGLGMEPLRVFSCNTLVVLKLGTDFFLNVPASVSLPCLKTLHLDSIDFEDEISTQRLFSSCLVLEDLVIEGCSMENISVLDLSSPSLKRLTLGKAKYMLSYFKLVLDAPSLLYLNYTICAREGGYTLKNLHSLSEAHISFGDPFFYCGRKALVKILEGIRSVKSLFLSVNRTDWVPLEWDGLPLLENLTSLVLTCQPFINFSLVMKLLWCSPNLEEFIFNGGIRDTHEDGCVDVPSCVSFRLKAINFNLLHYNGSGIEKDMESVEYFLKNANTLERMYICIRCFDFNKEAVAKVIERFKKLGRSKTCEIRLFHKITPIGRVERLLMRRELRMANRHRSIDSMHSIDEIRDRYGENWVLFNEEDSP